MARPRHAVSERVDNARIRRAARDVTRPETRDQRRGRPRGPALDPRITRILELQRLAGNRATTLALQRDTTPDTSKGERWNASKAYEVSNVRRVMVIGLVGGTSEKWQGSKGDSHHTDEPADHRAVVLVPDGFKPDKPAEVLLYFHGHTEASRGQYAGWRQRHFEPTRDETRKGFVSDDTVRDVALDQIEQQLHASGHGQMIGILPQGGPQHQFGDIPGDDYIADVLQKTHEQFPTVLKGMPGGWKVVVSGHSGGGFEVAKQVSRVGNLEGIVFFDAEGMRGEIEKRVNEDLDVLSDPRKNDAQRAEHLGKRPAVRVFARQGGKYGGMYGTVVEDTIGAWKHKHQLSAAQKAELHRLEQQVSCFSVPGGVCKELTPAQRTRRVTLLDRQAAVDAVNRFLPRLQRVYQVTLIDPDTVEHEEIVRGTKGRGVEYVKGEGTMEKALRSLP